MSFIEEVMLHGKRFELFLDEKVIAGAVASMATAINRDFQGRQVVLLGVLDGAFMVLSDLIKKLEISVTMEFVKLKSYEGESSTGEVKSLIGLNDGLRDKHVLVVEDIIDTGVTLGHLLNELRAHGPASVSLATLLIKKQVFQNKFPVEYFGRDIPNRFVVGYGMDYDGQGRQYPRIYAAVD